MRPASTSAAALRAARPGQLWVRRSIAATAAALLLLLLLTACTSQDQPGPAHYQPGPAAVQDSAHCSTAVDAESAPSEQAAQGRGRVPEGFVTVDAVLCTWSQGASSPTATTAVKPIVTKEHLSGDYTALLRALAEPSDRAQNVSCLDYAELVPELWLVNASGKAINVQWSLDGCEHSKPDTARALAALTVTKSTTLPGKATPMQAPQ